MSVWGGECAVAWSYRQTAAEWGVDLGGVRSIHHIVIQHMTDNIVWGIVCFKVSNYIIYWC